MPPGLISNAPSVEQTALTLPQPYLLFLGDVTHPAYAKTALGLRDWSPERCVGEYRLTEETISIGLPRLSFREARERGARAVVIGVVNRGGLVPEHWQHSLVEALEAGLDLIAGMHVRLSKMPALAEAAHRCGRSLIDVRVPPAQIPAGTGRKRAGKRLLTVGTDCALGKKYTALALTRAFERRGIAATFRATGQTGIMIAGGGMPLDAVVSDFVAGAAELVSPDAPPEHWDLIEGQGALTHPSYAGVSLGLLHGSQPDVFVVCHEPGREEMLGTPGFNVVSVEEVIELTTTLGRRTNPMIRCGGVAYNTSALDEAEAAALMVRDSKRLALPVADPVRGGAAFEALVASCLTDAD